jgi:hypothetical protein
MPAFLVEKFRNRICDWIICPYVYVKSILHIPKNAVQDKILKNLSIGHKHRTMRQRLGTIRNRDYIQLVPQYIQGFAGTLHNFGPPLHPPFMVAMKGD